MKKWNKKSNLDEMQELKLLQIEHRAFWILFWGLCITISIQGTFTHNPLYFLGESILLFPICIYIVTACIKNGIWDRKLKPNGKTNFLLSLVGGICSGLLVSIKNYMQLHNIFYAVVTFCLSTVFTAILCMTLLSVLAAIYNQKKEKLEREEDREEN